MYIRKFELKNMSKQLLLLLFFSQHRSIVVFFQSNYFWICRHAAHKGGVRKKIIINLVYIPVTTMTTRLPGTILNFHTVNNNIIT